MSWIQESVSKGKAANNFYSFNGTDVYIMHQLPKHVSIEEVLKKYLSEFQCISLTVWTLSILGSFKT